MSPERHGASVIDVVDCVVLGAGPAGLAPSRALSDRGIDPVVLERDRVGASWQTQRWDSFGLNTPGWCTGFVGDQHHDAFAALPEVLDRLRAMAATSPVREHVEVRQLRHAPGGFTLRATAGPVSTRTVVAATGDQNVPVAPRAAPRMPEDVAQLHAADYRNAAQLPAGVVLVVGAAQSGGQIAEDLRASGREVFSPRAESRGSPGTTAAARRSSGWSRPGSTTIVRPTCRILD